MIPLFSDTRPKFWTTFSAAYSIDDGHGGKIHVNVSEIFSYSKN